MVATTKPHTRNIRPFFLVVAHPIKLSTSLNSDLPRIVLPQKLQVTEDNGLVRQATQLQTSEVLQLLSEFTRERHLIHECNEPYAVGDGRIIADFGDLFRVSLDNNSNLQTMINKITTKSQILIIEKFSIKFWCIIIPAILLASLNYFSSVILTTQL